MFHELERKFDAINRLNSLYSELSAGIHGRKVNDLEMRVALERIVYDVASATADTNLLRKCTEGVNFIIAVKNKNGIQSFSMEDRRIILTSMPKEARQVWSDLE